MKRVLVLEDTPDLQRALCRFVERLEHEPVAAGSVAEALQALAEGGADLLLSDIELPDGSGVELSQLLRSRGVQVPVVLITGLHDMALAAEGMKAGAVDFLTKPLDLDHLAEVIERALGEAERSSKTRRSRAEGDSRDAAPHRVVGRHPSIVELFKQIGVAASGASPVLIRGESGTGKELVAREIHRHSRAGEPFVALNCASVPDSLVESELFGHEKGAFTGAVASRKGRFELAGEGTLFLDEIGDASPGFQATILRALQEGEFAALGGERSRRLRARVIAATHRPLEAMVADGSFRADLFYRIQVLELRVPALRERMSDLPALASYVLLRAARKASRPAPELSADALSLLLGHDWPGNVRELENVLERALVQARGDIVLAEHVRLPTGTRDSRSAPREGAGAGVDSESLDDVVLRHVQDVLARSGGNKREAARRLDISPGRLYRILGEPDEG